jgi:O-antigen ligase
MIRISLLLVYVLGFSAYAFRDWFKSLCALILLMAVIEHPDMPKSMLGIPGMNPWNLLFGCVVIAWWKARRREGLVWDMPKHINVLLGLYLAVILVGWGRLVLDRDMVSLSATDLVSELLINTLKWVVPGLILFDAARTRERFRLALLCVLGVYFLFAVQVIRWMPLGTAVSGASLSERSIKILVNEVGFHRVNMSAMLAAGSWAIYAALPFARTQLQKFAIVAASVITVFGQALTGGRAGYVTWVAVGFILCALRWRRYLLLGPVLVIGVLVLAPGVRDRMLEGFSGAASPAFGLDSGKSGPDVYAVTAGRNVAWPLVIEKIKERPITGWGRLAMIRTGITARLAAFEEGFSHPHNAYLEMLLDNGLIGFFLVMPFYGVVLWKSITLFLDSRDPLFYGIGGVSCAFLLALAIASSGSQTFYPREGWVGMWCALGLMLRVHLERSRVYASKPAKSAAPVRPTLRPGARAASPATAAVAFRPAMPSRVASRKEPPPSDLVAPPGSGTSSPPNTMAPAVSRTLRPGATFRAHPTPAPVRSPFGARRTR